MPSCRENTHTHTQIYADSTIAMVRKGDKTSTKRGKDIQQEWKNKFTGSGQTQQEWKRDRQDYTHMRTHTAFTGSSGVSHSKKVGMVSHIANKV